MRAPNQFRTQAKEYESVFITQEDCRQGLQHRREGEFFAETDDEINYAVHKGEKIWK